MVDTLLTSLLMKHNHPSTLLSMDSSASSSQEESDLQMNRLVTFTRRPDINLPLSAERGDPPQQWNVEHFDILDVGLAPQIYETDGYLNLPKVGKKCGNRIDNIWGAWFFFSFYFRPILDEKSKAKIVRDSNGISGFDKSDLQLDVFMVQHDMENMYMWVFKDRPENALGKMQLRSFMNGHSRPGERLFPFSVEKGFVRSHRMQRKHYRGLSNPQCVHGIEVVPSPNLMFLDEEDRKRWMALTGRDVSFYVPPEASDYSSWRNLPNAEYDVEKPPPLSKTKKPSPTRKSQNGSPLNLLTQPADHCNRDAREVSQVSRKRRKEDPCHGSKGNGYLVVNPPPDVEIQQTEPRWLNGFAGVLREVYGPVTGAKSIYEDEEGYLILISLSFVDPQKVKVSWRNTYEHGVIKVSCASTSRMPFIKRHHRTFILADPSPEHCPMGEFVREVPLPTRIPEGAKIEAYFDDSGTVLEVLVPKFLEGPEEHEVRIGLRPTSQGK